jgi:diguanylate cyclase
LTGALNRRGFDQACQRELARAQRDGKRLALAHIDLDDFKRLNDTLGHQAGDQVLVQLVELLHRSMRPSDVLCRFGGEEFVLMLPVNTVEEAVAAVSRFRREFSAQRVAGAQRAMSFSAGVTLLGVAESLEQAIERADAATYEAKRSGKNRVVCC